MTESVITGAETLIISGNKSKIPQGFDESCGIFVIMEGVFTFINSIRRFH